MEKLNSKLTALRVVNKKTGEVIDFLRGCSIRKAKNLAKGYDKRVNFTDLRVYRNVENPFYKGVSNG